MSPSIFHICMPLLISSSFIRKSNDNPQNDHFNTELWCMANLTSYTPTWMNFLHRYHNETYAFLFISSSTDIWNPTISIPSTSFLTFPKSPSLIITATLWEIWNYTATSRELDNVVECYIWSPSHSIRNTFILFSSGGWIFSALIM